MSGNPQFADSCEISTDLPATYDHEAHLRALQSLSRCLADWNDGYANHVDTAIDAEMEGDPTIDLVTPAFADTCFAAVAQSLAFITTTAAFVESFFRKCLPDMATRFSGKYDQGHDRFRKYGTLNPSFWDPTKPTTKGDTITRRILDILEGSELITRMGPEFSTVLDAIFKYRNQMIHSGFEWPLKERQKFAATIREGKWPHWFFISTVDDEPWCFTITPLFRKACLDLCERSVSTFGGLLGWNSSKPTDADLETEKFGGGEGS